MSFEVSATVSPVPLGPFATWSRCCDHHWHGAHRRGDNTGSWRSCPQISLSHPKYGSRSKRQEIWLIQRVVWDLCGESNFNHMSSMECETSKSRHNSYGNIDIKHPFGKEFSLIPFTLLSLYIKMTVLMRETGCMVMGVPVGRCRQRYCEEQTKQCLLPVSSSALGSYELFSRHQTLGQWLDEKKHHQDHSRWNV